ncbi:hypothetical protein F5Y02DRAFT_414926 [Annulohypoxylon stygium]|nr:hypothetical protein F5Y02DRAFT_414926 [Annulohypoxylon stygium]
MLANSLKASTVVLAALFAGNAVARTDLSGCVSSKTVAYGGASLIWYVPDTGEICAFLDCGGGRAPPKTTVPGCAAYSGTATYSPSYLPNFGATATAATVSSTVTSAAESSSATTSAPVSSATGSSSSANTITAAPTTSSLETSVTGSASSNSESSSSAGSSQEAASTSVSQGAAAAPTAVVKGALGVAVGLMAGVAML